MCRWWTYAGGGHVQAGDISPHLIDCFTLFFRFLDYHLAERSTLSVLRSGCRSAGNKTAILLQRVARDRAKYNWPWVKTEDVSSEPTESED